jgi:DNA-binding response OmpR family regulator
MNGREIKVMMIEDDPGDARLIKEMLADAKIVSFDFRHADRLSNGLECIKDGGIDLVLLDLSLPDSHGLETFKVLNTQTTGIPIIVLSGLDDEETALKAVQAGAQDYLVKGNIDVNLLVRSMRYAIERKQEEERLREKIEELERFKKITLDRELKMVELKERIRELEGMISGGG